MPSKSNGNRCLKRMRGLMIKTINIFGELLKCPKLDTLNHEDRQKLYWYISDKLQTYSNDKNLPFCNITAVIEKVAHEWNVDLSKQLEFFNLAEQDIKEGNLTATHDFIKQNQAVINQEVVNSSKEMTKEELLHNAKNKYTEKNGEKLARYLTATYYLKKHKIITQIETDTICLYKNDEGYFKPIGDKLLYEDYVNDFGEYATRTNTAEVMHLIRSKSYIDEKKQNEASSPNLIPLKNGVFDLETGKLLPHDPKYLFDYQIPVIYDEKATCPNIDKFFSEVVSEEDVSLIYDMFALAIYKKGYLEKFFVLTGVGSNGKTVLLQLLTSFIGADNTSGLPLSNLTEDKFAVSKLYKKLLNVGMDVGSKSIGDTSIIKSLTGGDLISAQFKFGSIFEFVNYATLVFSANNPPKFNDDSMGIYRRIEMINFPNQFGTDEDTKENSTIRKANPNLLKDLTIGMELSGLLNVVLKHLSNILKTGQLSVCKSMHSLKREYIKHSDTIRAFVENECVEDDYVHATSTNKATGFLTVRELFDRYSTFCKSNKLPPKTKEWFSRGLKGLTEWNLEIGLQDHTDNGKERTVRGIKFKTQQTRQTQQTQHSLSNTKLNTLSTLQEMGNAVFSVFTDDTVSENLISLIQSHDKGSGVAFEEMKSLSGLDETALNQKINDLSSKGDIFSPKANYWKVLS